MWQQVYDPLHSSALSALVAAVPIIFFLLGLTVLKLSGIKSAVISLALALVIGCGIFGMPVLAGAGSILHGSVALPHLRAFRRLRNRSLLHLLHLY